MKFEDLRVINLAIAPNTRRAYFHAGREFSVLRWEAELHVLWPIPAEQFTYYSVHPKSKGLSVNSIQDHLVVLAFRSKALEF